MEEEKVISTHVVAVMGFVKKDDKFLIAKRASDDPQSGGEWSIPGGKVEPGVSINILEDAMKREIKEEVGIEVKDDMHLIFNDAFTRVSGHHVIAITFLCFWKSGEAKALEHQEEIRWLTLEELKNTKKDMPDYLERRIEALSDYLRAHSYE